MDEISFEDILAAPAPAKKSAGDLSFEDILAPAAQGDGTEDQVSRYASRIPAEDPNADQVSRARGKYPQPETPLFKDIAQRNDLYRLADYTASREAIRADVAKRYRIDNGLEGKELSMAQMHEVERLTDEAFKQSKVKQPDQGFVEVAKEAFNAAAAEPVLFASEFAKETLGNLQWVLPIFAEFGLADAVKGASKAAMATRAVVRAGDAGLMGATIGASSSAIRQKQEQGEVTGQKLLNDAAIAGATTAVLQPVVAGMIALGGKAVSLRNGTKLTPENVQKGVADATKAMEEGATPEAAVRQVLDEMKVPEAEAAAIEQAVKEAADATKAAEPKIDLALEDLPRIDPALLPEKPTRADAGTAPVHDVEYDLAGKMIADLNADKGESWRPLANVMLAGKAGTKIDGRQIPGIETVGQLAKLVTSSDIPDMWKVMISAVARGTEDVPIKFRDTGDALGRYKFGRGVDEIQINPEKFNPNKPWEFVQTAIHEAEHARVASTIDTQPHAPPVKALDSLFSYVRDTYRQLDPKHQEQFGGEPYGFKNLHEFVSEVRSNPRFQDELRAFELPESLITQLQKTLGEKEPGLFKTAWKALTTLYGKIMGVAPKDMRAFAVAHDLVSRLEAYVTPAERQRSNETFLQTGRVKSLNAEDRKPIWRTSLGAALEKAPFNKEGMLGSQQLKLWLQANAAKHGVPKAEIEWSGLNEYLDMNKKVSLADVKTFLDQNGVKVEEVELGGGLSPADAQERAGEEIRSGQLSRDDFDRRINELVGEAPTKFHGYQLPGGENYRELLLTLPHKYKANAEGRDEKTPYFASSHFDQPNVLAHIRFNERRDAQGNRVLFIEEIQSDWAQKGRKEGFSANLKSNEELIRSGQWQPRNAGVPPAPFVGKTEAWVALALKRMIRYAADNGFDKIAWTKGEQQADRYDLSKHISEIHYSGTNLKAYDHNGAIAIERTGVKPEDLPDLIGKEAAEKLMAQKPQGTLRSLTGQDLKVGGEGMKSFYDKIVPNAANDILKKMGGGKVENLEVLDGSPTGRTMEVDNGPMFGGRQTIHIADNTMTQPGFEITPKMQEKAAQGMPLFQAGKIDQRLLAAMGLGSAGALATWIYTEDPFKAGLAGLTGAALTFATAKPVRSVLAAMGFHADQRWRITDLTDRYSGMIAGGELAHQRMYRALMKNLGPTSDARLKVMRDWMEADPTTPQGHAFRQANPLSAKEAAFVHAIEVGFDGGGQKLIAIGMDPTKLLENYVSHLWVPGLNTNKGILENLRAGFAERSNDISPGMSPHSRFSMRRSIPTYAEGERMGLMPVTNNPAAILQIYLNNVNKALANKQLQGALLRERTPWGERLMVVDMPEPALKEVLKRDAITARQLQLDPAEKKLLQDMHASIRAPASYVNIEHPQMKGFKVLSDIAPPLKHLFDARDPNVATKMAYNVSVAAKRALFSWSLFHAKSLLDALLGAGLKLPFKLAAARRALDDAGPAGDALMLGVKQGLRATGRPIEGDITPFTNALRLLGEKYPVVGAPAKAVNFITQKMDHFLWEYVHPTFKAAAFLAQFEKESTKRPNVPREQIAKEVASYVNDVFGSVDWFRIADGVSNKFGRDLALAVTSPSGRRFMQIAMLAPDWTVATGRSLLKAVPGVSSKEIGAMHRAYFVRSALIYATVADALNVAFSGHHFWENEDPTTVDMGDGRRLQLSKHFMEGIHWLTKPGQQALNKLGFVFSEPLKQAFNQEYLSTKGAPPIVKTNPNDSAGKQAISAAGQRMLHAVVSPLPITVQNLLSLTPGSAAAGFLGFPVLSKNEEQAVQAARERAEKQGKDVERAEKRVRKSYQKKQEKQDALR